MPPDLIQPVKITLPSSPAASAVKLLTDSPQLQKVFETAVHHGASDLLLCEGQKPRVRLNGTLKTLDTEPMNPGALADCIAASLTPTQRKAFAEQGSIDLGLDLDLGEAGQSRFRVNIYRTRGRVAMAARHFLNNTLDLKALNLPPVMAQITQVRQGLVLVGGNSGSGKTTTVAAMLEHINTTRPCHIITLEDPIEYVLADDKAMISQREVGTDVPSFAVGLRALARENPDVIVIGEMRDRETFETAMLAAETGHLVFGTIQASSTTQVFHRIYDHFTSQELDTVRKMLAYQLQAIVYQKLLPTTHDEPPMRVPATEVLLQSPAVRSYILEKRENELTQIIHSSRAGGMQTMTDNLIELIQNHHIHPNTAAAAAANPDELKLRLRGIEAC